MVSDIYIQRCKRFLTFISEKTEWSVSLGEKVPKKSATKSQYYISYVPVRTTLTYFLVSKRATQDFAQHGRMTQCFQSLI